MNILDNIDDFHIKDIKNDDHPSAFFKHEHYDLFILRVPNLLNENKLTYLSLAFVITEQNYFFYDKENSNFIDLKNIMGFYTYLDKYVNNVLETISYYWANIETIEDKIYMDNHVKGFNKDWYIYKTDLIRINRILIKANEIINILIKEYKKEEDYLERNFEDIHEHLNRSQRNSEYLLEKLDSIYNFNLNQTNEQMNRIVYILTLLSGIFLPLNLIVGFFGMNTTSLPFTKVDGGTFNVIFLLIISAFLATLITYFMKKR